MLNTEQFGIYTTYMAYEGILAILLGLGMYSSIKNAYIDFPEKLEDYVSTLITLTLIPLFICLTLVTVFPNYFSSLIGIPHFLLYMLILQSFGSAMLSVSNSRLAIDYNYKRYMVFAGINTFLNVGLSIAFILTFFSVNREYGRIFGSAIPLIGIGIYIFIYYIRPRKFNLRLAKYAIKIGFPLIWHYLSQQIQNQFDRIAITRIVGASFTGIYSFVYSIANILQVIFYSTENVWTVWLYEQMSKKQYIKIRETSKKYIFLITCVAILMLVGFREVIVIMGDRGYWEGVTISIPILIGIYLLFLYTIPVGIEYFFKKTQYIALMTGVAAVLNIILNYLLIPYFGYIAAAYTTLISYGVQFIGHWIISCIILKENNIKTIFDLSYMVKMFSFVCASGIAVYYLNAFPVIKYCVFALLFAYIYVRKKNDIQLLVNMMIKRKGGR